MDRGVAVRQATELRLPFFPGASAFCIWMVFGGGIGSIRKEPTRAYSELAKHVYPY